MSDLAHEIRELVSLARTKSWLLDEFISVMEQTAEGLKDEFIAVDLSKTGDPFYGNYIKRAELTISSVNDPSKFYSVMRLYTFRERSIIVEMDFPSCQFQVKSPKKLSFIIKEHVVDPEFIGLLLSLSATTDASVTG